MTAPAPVRPSVVVVGGGFAGFYAARTLERLLPAEAVELTIVSSTASAGSSRSRVRAA